MIGYIRAYDNGTGVGMVFVVQEEATLGFNDGGGSNFAVGQKVSVNGKLANSVWTASRITVGAKLIHQP